MTPVLVSGLTNVVAISAGYKHSCAVLANGTAKCWGSNTAGELGNGTRNLGDPTAIAVSGLTNVVAISVATVRFVRVAGGRDCQVRGV